ncbi:MAG: prephenate dehydratase [Rickettsiales bacterium]|nr:prephenate dehydratase [Rickettsiales bacterium]
MSKLMKEKIIAYQGVRGANSNLACEKFYEKYEAKAFSTFYDVFSAVEKGGAEYGMIPLENSYAGRVSEIHNLLQGSDVSIVAEHFFPITHNLVGVQGAKIEDIEEVYSHPQALLQSQNSLRELGVDVIESSNTAAAAEYVAKANDIKKAALCSKKAAENNGLNILKENLQDSGNDNVTIFIVIAKNPSDCNPEISPVITAMLFTIRNIPGSLYKALGGFATNNVSIVKLESYIPGGVSRQAQFYISIEGHPSQRNVALALEELGFFSKSVKLLGVYYSDKARKK